MSEGGSRDRITRGSEADAGSRRAWRIDRGRGLGGYVSPAVGVWIDAGIGAGRGAGLVGLTLVAAQVAELLDGAKEAAAEMSIVASQVN